MNLIMFWIGVYAELCQRAIMGEPKPVTVKQLGHLGKRQ